MINYSEEWKKYVNFISIDYDTFIDDYKNKKFFYSNKIDGQLSALVYNRNESCKLLSINNIVIENIPILKEYKYILDKYFMFNNAVLIGELVGVKNNNILPFSGSMGIIKTYSKNGEYINQFLYDFYYTNNKKIEYKESLYYLNRLKNIKTKYIHVLNQKFGNINIFNKYWKEIDLSKGIEGVVARNDNGNAIKIKPKNSFDLVVVGCGNKNMISWNRDQISYLIVAFVDENNNFRYCSKVGGGFSLKLREYFYDYCMKNKLYSTVKGEIFIKPKLVIEVEFGDYNKTIDKCYEYKKNNYNFIGKKETYSLRFPRFIRIRDDKKVNNYECGFRQIPE